MWSPTGTHASSARSPSSPCRRTNKDDTAKRRFLQEAQAASALDHPNICTIYEINETADGQLYLVMAAYEGGDAHGTDQQRAAVSRCVRLLAR